MCAPLKRARSLMGRHQRRARDDSFYFNCLNTFATENLFFSWFNGVWEDLKYINLNLKLSTNMFPRRRRRPGLKVKTGFPSSAGVGGLFVFQTEVK